MPVTYQIDRDQAVIRTRCSGYVTFPEVMAHFHALELEDDCPNPLDVVLDLSETTSLPSSDQLRSVSKEIGRLRPTVAFGACAIVARTEALYGTAMVFEVFAARGFRTTRVFRQASTAEAWLTEQKAIA
jgi:hypothetical protein